MASIAQVTVRFGADLREFSSKMQNANREILALGRTMQNTGRNLTRNLTLPILAIGAASTKLALDFDTSMTKIQTLVGLSTDTVEGFKKSVLDIAGRTAQAPAALADALFTVTSAGLRGAESLEVLEMAAKGSAVGMGETKEIARAVTAVMQAYGPEVINASKAMDIFTATVREGNLEASELAPVLGRVLPVASQLGVSFEEIGANIAVFTRLGIQSSEAVTGLRGVLNSLLKPTSQGEEALASIGLTFEKLKDQVKNDGLAETLIRLTKSFKGNEEAISKVFPNVEALTAVLATAGAQGEAYVKALDSTTNSTGGLNEAMEDTAKSGAFQFRSALATLQQVGTDIGNILLPVLANVAKEVKNLISGFRNLSPETQTMIVKVAALVAAVGPLVLGIGSLITGFGALLGTLKTVGLFLATNPWFALAGAVAAVATAIIGYNSLSRTFNEAQKSSTALVEEEQRSLNTLVKTITNLEDGNETRLALIEDLKSNYPEFIAQIGDEELNNKNLRTALDAVNKEYIKKIALASAEDQIKANLQAQKETLEKIKNLEIERTKLKAAAITQDTLQAQQDYNDKILATTGAIELNQASLANLREEVKATIATYESLASAAFGASSATASSGGGFSGGTKRTSVEHIDSKDLMNNVIPALQTTSEELKGVNTWTEEAQRRWANWNNEMNNTPTLMEDVVGGAFVSLGNIINGVFTDIFSGAKVSFSGIIKLVQGLIAKLAAAAITAAILSALLPNGAAKTANAAETGSSFAGFFKSIFGGFRAAGGPVSSGSSYIVGEKGPELFTPGSSGSITPNHMLGGGGNISIQFVGSIPLVWNGQGLSGMINQENIRVRKFGA